MAVDSSLIWDKLTAERLSRAIADVKRSKLTVRETPLLVIDRSQSPLVNSLGLNKLFLKLENLQLCGSFKIRGIVNFLARQEGLLDASTKKPRFVTMSAGNFGRSFSFVCGLLGYELLVIMPVDVPEERVNAIKKNGANVLLLPRTELQQRVDDLVSHDGMTYAHPFDDLDLIAGYGSITQEIANDLQRTGDHVDLLISGIGGGGLLSGILSAHHQLCRFQGSPLESCKFIGVEPEGACAMYQSLKEGRPVTLQKITSFVNGLSAPFAGSNCFEIFRSLSTEVVLVHDEKVKEAMRILTDDFKLLVESSGAASLAALCDLPPDSIRNKNVCLVISGGNISIEELSSILKSSLSN